MHAHIRSTQQLYPTALSKPLLNHFWWFFLDRSSKATGYHHWRVTIGNPCQDYCLQPTCAIQDACTATYVVYIAKKCRVLWQQLLPWLAKNLLRILLAVVINNDNSIIMSTTKLVVAVAAAVVTSDNHNNNVLPPCILVHTLQDCFDPNVPLLIAILLVLPNIPHLVRLIRRLLLLPSKRRNHGLNWNHWPRWPSHRLHILTSRCTCPSIDRICHSPPSLGNMLWDTRFILWSYILHPSRFNLDTSSTYLREASIYNHEKLLSAAVKICATKLESLKISQLGNLEPRLFQIIVTSPNCNCDSEILSSRVATYLRCRPGSHNLNFLQPITAPSKMPRIASDDSLFIY
jgi:hypothetical protein